MCPVTPNAVRSAITRRLDAFALGLIGAGSLQKGRGTMRVGYCVGMLLCIMALCCPVISQAAVPPPGSFLTKSVSNPEELAKLIESDKRVGERYSRHFGMSVKELAEYARKNLKVSQLKTSGKFTAYYISSGNRILVHTKSFKAGRKVFVTPDGKPVIDVVCGNPLVRSLPKIVVKVETKKEEIVPPPVVEQPRIVAEIPTTVPEAPPPPEVEVLNMPPTEFSSAASLLSKAVLPGLLAVGVSTVFGHEPPPVPEPAGLIVLGSSLTILTVGIRIRRRSNRDVSNK